MFKKKKLNYIINYFSLAHSQARELNPYRPGFCEKDTLPVERFPHS